jgi:hypothetical protein
MKINSRRRKVMLITQHPQHLVSCRSFLMPRTNELLVIFPLWGRNAWVVCRRLWNKLLYLHWLHFRSSFGLRLEVLQIIFTLLAFEERSREAAMIM